MSPEAARASYLRQLSAHGERVTLRREVPNGSPIEVSVRARLTGGAELEVTPGRSVSDRRAIVLAEDVEGSAFPLPIVAGGRDSLIVRDTKLVIRSVDDTTRRIAGVLIAFELLVSP